MAATNNKNDVKYMLAFKNHVDKLLHLARAIPDQQKATVKEYLSSSFHDILGILDEARSSFEHQKDQHIIDNLEYEKDGCSEACESGDLIENENNRGLRSCSGTADIDDTVIQKDHQVFDGSLLLNKQNKCEAQNEMEPNESAGSPDLDCSLRSSMFETAVVNDRLPVSQEQENCVKSRSEMLSIENDSLNNEAELTGNVKDAHVEAEVTLLEDIEKVKPKSNIPSVKDASPETDDVSDMSSLLSFLPQLSPYIKLEGCDTGIGDRDGYIHLTVERADGSVQNLKIGGVVTTTVDEQDQTENKQDTSNDKIDDSQIDHTQEQLQNSEKENDPAKETSSEDERRPQFIRRPRGRPKKTQIFNPVLTEKEELVYKCPHCSDVVKSHHAMIVHVRKHTGEKPFSCQFCGKSFTTKGNMKQHEKTTHSDSKPWPCQYCSKSFKEKKVLMVHERTHTGERPYKCHMCSKSFAQTGVLKEHLLIHTGQKPHLCDLCGQEFRGASALKAHKLRHLNRRDFKCDQCGKDFVSKVDLKRHIQTHTGLKPFLCTFCPKSFTRLSYLKEHMNFHRGLKPFSCRVCGASFSESTTLHRHKKKHKPDAEDQSKNRQQSELEKELTSGSGETNIPATETLGQTSVQLVLEENTTIEDFQRLHSLLSTGNGADYSLPVHDSVKHIYQVLCVNPDTQEITPALGVDGQGPTDFSAINLLANATAQQYTLQ